MHIIKIIKCISYKITLIINNLILKELVVVHNLDLSNQAITIKKEMATE